MLGTPVFTCLCGLTFTSLGLVPRMERRVLWYPTFNSLRNCHTSPQWLQHFTFPAETPRASTSPALRTTRYVPFFDSNSSSGCEVESHCIYLMTNDGQHLAMCLLAICVSSLEQRPFRYYGHFLIGWSFYYSAVRVFYVFCTQVP